MITKKYLKDAPMWTIFKGPAEDPGPIAWGLFNIEPVDEHPEDVVDKMEELWVFLEEPEKFDGDAQPREDVDDIDAALMHLRAGGTLCKVPDTMDSKYWRLLVVETPADAQAVRDKNCGGFRMIVKNSPTLDRTMPITSMIGMTRAHIQTRDKITRAEDPSYFPPNYDPAHGSTQGTTSTRGGIMWERFKTDFDSAMVPQVLINFVRVAHPGCTWQVKGVSLFAVSKTLEVVAVLHIIGDW